MRKFILFVLMIALFAPFFAAAQGGFFDVKGKEVIGPDGKPFMMRGTNLGNWLMPEGYMFKFNKTNSPKMINEAITELLGPADATRFWDTYLHTYIQQADIHYLKSIGVNSIRIPFNYRLFTHEDYLGGNDADRGFELLDRVIGWCKTEGIYVILDMHAAPGGQTGDNIDDGFGYPFLFKSDYEQGKCVAIWKRIAEHYKNETTIIGYDLLNEPIATYFDANELNPYLEPLYKKITDAIRTVDKRHLIILGGAQWDSNFKAFGAPFDSKLVYQFHKYWTPPTKEVIQDYLDFRDKYNVPIYCGETGENKDGWVDTFKNVLEQNHVGWHYWPYKKMENLSGFVTFSMPANYDMVIAFAESSRTSFEEIRKATPANREAVKKALFDFINNSRFENCRVNKGYVGALGFKIN